MDFRFIWGVFMAVVYIGVACLIVLTPMLSNAVSNVLYYLGFEDWSQNGYLALRIVAGILLLIYGLSRGYRIWKNK